MSILEKLETDRRARILTVIGAIVIALLFTASDSWLRYSRIMACTNCKLDAPKPKLDPNSPTGYEHGLRVLLLPPVGVDGCQWIMHTQKMLAQGDWRIRYTDIDNSPDGREIHWSHGFIWWLIALGKLHASITDYPLAASVEAVSPYANTLIFVTLLATLPWLTYHHFGPIAAAGFAVAMGTVYTFYEYFMVGNADHHGIAAAGALVCSLLLAVGGAGWVKDSDVPNKDSGSRSGGKKPKKERFEYHIDPATAKRYFMGSAFAGSVSLWVSAATAVPRFSGLDWELSYRRFCLVGWNQKMSHDTSRNSGVAGGLSDALAPSFSIFSSIFLITWGCGWKSTIHSMRLPGLEVENFCADSRAGEVLGKSHGREMGLWPPWELP